MSVGVGLDIGTNMLVAASMNGEGRRIMVPIRAGIL